MGRKVDNRSASTIKQASEKYRNETKESSKNGAALAGCPLGFPRQARAALAPALRRRPAERHPHRAASRPGAGARAHRFLPPPAGPRHRLPVPPGRRGELLGRRPRGRAGREIHEGVLRAGAPHPEAERQDQHPGGRGGRLPGVRERGGRGAAGGRRGGVHDVRGDATAGRGDPRVPEGAAGL